MKIYNILLYTFVSLCVGNYTDAPVESSHHLIFRPVKGEDKPFKRVDKEIIKFKNEKRDIEFHPLSIQWHPYPYITTPEIYLFNAEDDEDYKPSPAVSIE